MTWGQRHGTRPSPHLGTMKRIFSLLLLSTALVFSADPDESSLSTGEQIERAMEEFKRVDAELQSVFNKKIDKEKAPQLREALIAAQRAWRHFRDADGHYTSVSFEGGSARMYYVNKRMTEVTRRRINELSAEEEE